MPPKLGVEDSPIRAILNAMDALEFIAQSRQGIGVRELARALRMSPATAGRVLASLYASNMLNQNEDTSRYTLGPRALKIAADYRRNLNLLNIANRYLTELMEETGETVFLGVLDGSEVVVVNRIDSRQPLRIAGELGTREPAHCTALGKMLLSSCSAAKLEQLLPQFDFQFAVNNRVSTSEELMETLKLTRERGWALDDQEHFDGVRCVAANIRDSEGSTIAAISVSGPTVRINDERLDSLVKVVLDKSAQISMHFGHQITTNLEPVSQIK